MARSDAEARAAALALARNSNDTQALDRLKRRKKSIIRTRVVLGVGSVIVGAAIAIILAGIIKRPSTASSVATWRHVVGWTLLVVGLAIEIVVIVVRIRSEEFEKGWRSHSLVLTRRQRRQLLEQIRGLQPVDPEMLPVSRYLATRLARQRMLIGLWVALPMILAGQATQFNKVWLWWIASVVVALYGFVVIQTVRDSKRAERFLAQHPEPLPLAGDSDLV